MPPSALKSLLPSETLIRELTQAAVPRDGSRKPSWLLLPIIGLTWLAVCLLVIVAGLVTLGIRLVRWTLARVLPAGQARRQ